MKKLFSISIVAATFLGASTIYARPSNTTPLLPNNGQHKNLAGCTNPVSSKFLDVNNVRALLMNAGDMWYDMATSKAAYVVPKNGASGASSLFAGSVWIGGNSGGTRKVAAQMYRADGTDYWSGPLDNNAAITAADCAIWDKMWKLNKSDITTFRSLYSADSSQSKRIQDISNKLSLVPQIIKEWPARGNADAIGSGGAALNLGNSTKNYADFVDLDNDGKYDYRKGDYPKILGDQYIWWVFNDMGNTKTMTKSDGIGLEVQTGAFAFATADCLNESTFYNYRVINRGSNTLDSTYMSTFTDADLGFYLDDYVGCDVGRGLGILYNGENYDPGATGYGSDIPMVGVDFFIGPKRIVWDAAKSKYDTTLLQMTNFTFFNNTKDNNGNPSNANEFYNLMTGKNRAGEPFTLSCTGVDPSAPITPYVYPDNFKECSPCHNDPADKRFVHSAGPFILYPNAVNDITIGVVWVPSVGGNCPSFGKIQVCDDKAQQLFDDSFRLKLGPEAPDLITKPFDRKVVFYLNNPYGSNNFNESYGKKDSAGIQRGKYIEYSTKALKMTSNNYDTSAYKFQGYIIYQLKNKSISMSAIRNADGTVNTDNAKIAFQCDKKDGITKEFNFAKDPTKSDDYYYANLMVVGADSGIKNNFMLNQDLFSSQSNKTMVNYKTYYYVAIAYSYNNFAPFDFNLAGKTQDVQYLESRVNGREGPISVIEVTPTPAYDVLYTNNGATYGDGIVIKRLEGRGNDGNELDMTTESENEAIQAPYQSYYPTYKPNAGPVSVKVISPDSIKAGNYEIYLNVKAAYDQSSDTSRGAKADSTTWKIIRTLATGTPDTMYSTSTIANYNEQMLVKWGTDIRPIEEWGMSVAIQQQLRPGDYGTTGMKNGLINSTGEYENPSYPWLSGVKEEDGNSLNNWIRSGLSTSGSPTSTYPTPINGCNMGDLVPNYDKENIYNGVLGGTWAPYAMTSDIKDGKCGFGLKWKNETSSKPVNPLKSIPSIDVVFTSDRSKWTKCSVIEMNDGTTSGTVANLSEGLALKFNLRKHASLELEADANGNPVYNTSGDMGHSWFPGYAINQETGERLNIVFGEDSWDRQDNGNDMVFNPTSTVLNPIDGSLRWGGRHVIYISRTKYDALGTDTIYNSLNSMDAQKKLDIYNTMVWCSPALLTNGFKFKTYGEGLIPNTLRLRLRVTRPYANYKPAGGLPLKNGGNPLYSFNTNDIAPKKLNDANNIYNTDDKALLDNILVVPNPYYAYSTYETSRLDTKVKIVNLPYVASIHIYATDGTLIRTLSKSDAATTFVDWDLKNEKGIQISSGMYLLHVKIKTDNGDKETVLKWFGVMRPTDIIQY